MDYFNILFELTKKAYKKNEVPIAAIIVSKNKIISTAFNKRHNRNDVLGHAEIIAIKKATKKLKTWHLVDCDVYVTVEPCKMCKNIIEEAKIKNVYYFLKNPKVKLNKTKYTFITNEKSHLLKKQIQNFFKTKR